ncbi:hypothetical protein ACYJ2U_001486 [Clostridium botulinum]
MLNGKMSLRIKLLTLPFSEIKFYDHDYIDDLALNIRIIKVMKKNALANV